MRMYCAELRLANPKKGRGRRVEEKEWSHNAIANEKRAQLLERFLLQIDH